MVSFAPQFLCGNDTSLLHPGWQNSTNIPDVTNCGQHTLFSAFPVLFLGLFSPLVFFSLHKSQHSELQNCSPITLRIIFGCLLVVNLTITVIYDFFLLFSKSNLYDPSHMFGDLTQYAGLCLALVLTIACKNRGIVTSGVVTLFWLIVIICGLPELKFITSAILSDEHQADHIRSGLYVSAYVLSTLEFIICCFADIPSDGYFGKKKCPELNSSFMNQLTFEWFSGLAYLGNRKSLDREDLWDLNERDKSENLIPDFMRNMKPQIDEYQDKIKKNRGDAVKKNFPSILVPIFKTYKFTFLAGGCYKLAFDLLQFVSPALLRQLIGFIEDKNQPFWIGISIALLMFLSSLVQSLILHQYFHEMFRLGMNIRSVLTNAVYVKTLNLSNEAKRGKTTGAIVNLMSVDVQRIQDMTTFIMLFWSAPLQILLSLYFLWKLLGVSVLAGFVILILMIPFNSWISIKMRNCQMEQMKYKDERIKMMSEILNGVKVLKLYSWEKSMEQVILDIREKEIRVLKKLSYLNAATALSWACAPFLVAVLTFGLYVLWDPEHNILTPQITFVALALFNILRFPLAVFAMIFSQAVQCAASNTRLREFFASEEMAQHTSIMYGGTDIAIKIADGAFSWGSSVADQFLHDINFEIKKGQLVAIVGRVGSGKSSLLCALLEEMKKSAGTVQVNGSMSYVPQQAWIQNLSLRNNILFGKPFSHQDYKNVINFCALNQDLDSLPAGDDTEIGEKGINLSGGQKQRVSLARAVYQNSEIILLDDPLSAVDSHVGKQIFENVISSNTGCLAGKTRILVTHGLTYLKHCDKIIVMKAGTISEIGTYQELMNSNGAFSDFLEEFLLDESKHRGRSVSFGENSEEVNEILKELDHFSPRICKRIQKQLSQEFGKDDACSNQSETLKPSENDFSDPTEQADEKMALLEKKPAHLTNLDTKPKKLNQRLIEKELIETGKVELSIYTLYFRAIGVPIAILFFIIYVASSLLGVFSNLYLAHWSDNAKRISLSGNVSGTETQMRLGIYAVLGMGQASSVCGASVIMALGMVRASRLLHANLLHNIMRSPMSFFDVTPLGRILNRFGKDVEAIDSKMPGVITTFVGAIVQAASIFAVSLYATPSSLLLLAPTVYGYLRLLRFYVSTSRQLKRLESASRSPVYSHFQESIQGATSIRAYRAVDVFVRESQRRVDENLAVYYPSIVANRWLAVRLELVGNLIVLSAAGAAVYFRNSVGLTAGLVGLSVSYALNITQTLNWAVRMTSELETNIVAVERIREYTTTPIEGNSTHKIVSNDWPQNGDISIKNFSVRYRPGLELVLDDVSADIRGKEKIGIVGRTGAGKSSLTLALFRIIEADSGSIEIDGQNIADMELEHLRSRLTIVPQDPVLFSGTFRINLDPFHAFSDAEIWESLRNSHLEPFVRSLPEGLSHVISEGGENLSVGQRQLICLARALLRKTRILVLDEAAAAVDMETDALLQKTIKEQFKECTVLTIAHRLNTIMDSDRLLVLEKGRVAEFDHPKVLLSNTNSIFFSMAKDANLI